MVQRNNRLNFPYNVLYIHVIHASTGFHIRTHYTMQLIKNSVHTPIVQSMSEFVFVYTFIMFYLNSKQKHNIFTNNTDI